MTTVGVMSRFRERFPGFNDSARILVWKIAEVIMSETTGKNVVVYTTST
jgi:hypothetical protein